MAQPKTRRILVVDDEEIFAFAMTRILESEGLEPVVASSIEQARTLLETERFDLILSDIHVHGSGMNGVDLLVAIRNESKTPVILMTGMTEIAELRESGAEGAAAVLAKPFRKEDLQSAIRKALGIAVEGTPAEGSVREEQYMKVGIDDFICGKEIKYRIFVQLNDQKFVKIAHQGEDLDPVRIQEYKDRGIRHLYLTKDDFLQYMSFNLDLSRTALQSEEVSYERKVKILKHTEEILLSRAFVDGVDKQAVEDAISMVEATVQFLGDTDEHLNLLETLSSPTDFLYAHSIAASVYSTLIARQMGWTTPQQLYQLSMGALLHDIGYRQIKRDLLEKPENELTQKERAAVHSHPERGATILSQMPNISVEVVQIVRQHHERDSGGGYPLGLRRQKIAPMAQVVAVADEFCHLALKTETKPGMKPKEAYKSLMASRGEELDSVTLKALERVLRISGI